ncbi:hypothetical protein SAMN04488004_1322 [Loktanella salsilacus]|uniref:Integrase catalytic domain-containing protein n=1 Tax=Loktanella salsilacus TaxID=195913 RepID=A0A1I4J1E3_9RHOB|nr:hypothetical protein SAMN04488004_1322 [Loktanella salsilacus]
MNIEILCANSSQVKDRVERANRTLQDQLIKELRLAGVSSIEDGNVFLPGFLERYNAKFAKAPARSDTLHRALNIAPNRLSEVFCLRDKRHVTKDLMLKYDRKRIKLAVNDLTRDLARTYVDVYELADGRIQVRAKGVTLPNTIMNPKRRITHTAITENKHLSAVLAHIKAEQDKALHQNRRSNLSVPRTATSRMAVHPADRPSWSCITRLNAQRRHRPGPKADVG